MSFLGPRIPVSIYLYREDSSTIVELPRRRASPTLTKRRSVSSMKGLLPLALPSSQSSSSSNLPLDEPSEDNVDSYLPEVLARDLEISSAVFEAKNMTSGSPSPSIMFEDDFKSWSMPCPSRIHASPYRSASVRMRTLGRIEERNSMVSFLDQKSYAVTDPASDVDSASETESLIEPSDRVREHSIITTATSLTSTCESASSPTNTVARSRSRGHSWIAEDSEEDHVYEATDDESSLSLSPRPQAPSDTESLPGATENERKLSRPQIPPRAPYRTPGFKTDGPVVPQRELSVKSAPALDVPIRRTRCTLATSEDMLRARHRSQSPKVDRGSVKKKRHRNIEFPPPKHHAPSVQIESPTAFRMSPDRIHDTNPLGLHDNSSVETDHPEHTRHDSVYIQPSPPPSPLPSVQAWLDSENQPFASQQPSVDHLAKVVPLPPDITETLRVSIACFPETMLLTSSLTIETVRAYSRKVRHMPHETWRDDPDHQSLVPRKSIWKKVVSHGRGQISTRLHRTPSSGAGTEAYAANSTGQMSPWASLMSVFGTGSDYICDALYAHIVAYNYMSRIPCGQTPVELKRGSTTSSRKSQKEDIPKKAASLLGLNGPSDPASLGTGRLAKKLSSPLMSWGSNRDQGDANSATSPVHDMATRNIQAGLLRCIMRLVATVRMMVDEGLAEHYMVEADAKDVDMLLIRSLCEMVRISEETTEA